MDMQKYKKVLVLAVGGGNDSVSTVMLQMQLAKSFNYKPTHIDIVAMLPDCLTYSGMEPTDCERVFEITPQSQRKVGEKVISAFPERVLSANKSRFNELNIKNVFGISMDKGSVGLEQSLTQLIQNEYDLVLAVDVGGDFIAHPENKEVLSPLMDGYMLYALQQVQKSVQIKSKPEFVFCVFGLGTDGESTPEMLRKALSLLPDVKEHSFNQQDVQPIIDFYREVVEPNRYSRTTDYTIKEITGEGHENPSLFRGRFHVQPHPREASKVYYGNFMHKQDSAFYGKFYIFQDISQLRNPYAFACNSGVEWVLKVQSCKEKINHELNGQTYSDIGKVLNIPALGGKSLFFATPSHKFNAEQISEIIDLTVCAIRFDVYDSAIVYNCELNHKFRNIHKLDLNNGLSLISMNQNILSEFETYWTQLKT